MIAGSGSGSRSTIFLLGAAALLAGILLPGCAFRPGYALDDSIRQYGVNLPDAPASWTAVAAKDAGLLVSATVSWGPASMPGALPAERPARAVASSYYALSADWLDERDSIDAAVMGLEAAVALAEPLEAIRLPRRVLAYEGLYPGDPGYRLVRTVSVTVEVVQEQASPARLRRLQAAALEYLQSFPEPPKPAGLSWLGAVGDVMPGQGTAKLLLQPDGPERVFRRLLPVMQAQDVLVANLETAVTDRGTEWPKTFRFRMPAAALPPLLDSGIDVVSLANNHVYDYTAVGFSDTVAALRSAGLPFVGAGLSWDEAVAPYESATGAARVAVWALGAFPVERTGFYGLKHASIQRGEPGLLWADDAAVSAVGAAMAARRGNGQLLVVSVHAGLEYTYGPYEVQTSLYRKLVDLGADVILGHHPHVLQPMEWYDGPGRSGLIVYSLGNFVFDNIEDNPKGFETMLLSLGYSGGAIRAIRIYPARMDGYAVDIADDGAPRALVRSMSAAWAVKTADAPR